MAEMVTIDGQEYMKRNPLGVLGLTVGVWWSVHLWAGTIVLTGLAGLLLSMLLVPPLVPEVAQEGA